MPTGVMDIKHLLCYPSNTTLSLMNDEKQEISSIFLQKSYQEQVVAVSPSYNSEVEFWRHSRSSSTQSSCNSSISSNDSCSTIINNDSSNNYYHYHFNSPTIEKRQRINSELCRSYSALINVNDDLIASKKSRQRSRCNSTSSYIQTRNPWTPEEDNLLQKGYEQGLSWAMISSTYLPNRSRGCCWGRFKTLQSKNVIEVYQKRICQRPWKITNLKNKYNDQQ